MPVSRILRYFKYYSFAFHQIIVAFLCILRWGRYFYDRRTEKILQCNEKVGIQETSKTHSKTLGKLNFSLGKCIAKMQFNSLKSVYIYILHINYSYHLYIDTHTVPHQKVDWIILWVKHLLSSLHKYYWVLYSPWNW